MYTVLDHLGEKIVLREKDYMAALNTTTLGIRRQKIMPKKFLNYTLNQKNRIFCKLLLLMTFLISGCGIFAIKQRKLNPNKSSQMPENKRLISVQCSASEKAKTYELGDLICTKNSIKINDADILKIEFIVKNKKSEDPYEHGYHELVRLKNTNIIERIKLRNSNDAYWSEMPFVRIRKQKYLYDLDQDGYKEFAILPFHPGSAIWLTARIYSLKEKIEYWGKGRYRFEGDPFVQLNCLDCSKFNPDACKKCE